MPICALSATFPLSPFRVKFINALTAPRPRLHGGREGRPANEIKYLFSLQITTANGRRERKLPTLRTPRNLSRVLHYDARPRTVSALISRR